MESNHRRSRIPNNQINSISIDTPLRSNTVKCIGTTFNVSRIVPSKRIKDRIVKSIFVGIIDRQIQKGSRITIYRIVTHHHKSIDDRGIVPKVHAINFPNKRIANRSIYKGIRAVIDGQIQGDKRITAHRIQGIKGIYPRIGVGLPFPFVKITSSICKTIRSGLSNVQIQGSIHTTIIQKLIHS